MSKTTTEVLNHKLLKTTDLKAFIKEHQSDIRMDSFCNCLYDLIVSKGLKASEVFFSAQLSESYGYQLLNGKRQPSRDKILQLAFGFPLSIRETNTLLRLAEKSELYVKNKRDAIVLFSLNNHMSLLSANELLDEEQCDILE